MESWGEGKRGAEKVALCRAWSKLGGYKPLSAVAPLTFQVDTKCSSGQLEIALPTPQAPKPPSHLHLFF